MSEKTNKLNIYLIKMDILPGEIMKPGVVSALIDGVGTFYGANSHAIQPSWFGAKTIRVSSAARA
jgi:hypothetical protein